MHKYAVAEYEKFYLKKEREKTLDKAKAIAEIKKALKGAC